MTFSDTALYPKSLHSVSSAYALLASFFFCAFVLLLLLSSARDFFRQIFLVPKNAGELMILRQKKKSPVPVVRIAKVSVVEIPQLRRHLKHNLEEENKTSMWWSS